MVYKNAPKPLSFRADTALFQTVQRTSLFWMVSKLVVSESKAPTFGRSTFWGPASGALNFVRMNR